MIATREQLKIWFRKGLYPLESQFHAWIDSFWHKSEKLPMSQIEGLAEAINGKADASVIDTKQNKNDDSLQTQNKTVTGAINEIKNNLDDATLSSGRLNAIDNEGHINSSLVQGDGISIDESSGIIKADRKWHIDGEIMAIQESLSGHTAKTTAGNTYYYDTEQETLNIIIGKNTKYLYIAANKLVLPVSSINFLMSDEFGIPDKMLRGSMVLEIYYDTYNGSTSNLKSVTFKSEGSTDILQYGFDNPYQREKDLNRVYFEVGSVIYPSLIKILSVSKMYQKKWLAENGVKLEDNVISGDYKAGDGIKIDESTATISAEPNDYLFKQADSSRGNLCDIYDMSIKTTAYGEDQTPMPILEAAEAMPVDYEINLTNSDVVKFSIPGIIDQNAGQCNNDGLTFTTNSYQTYFHGEKLQGHYDRNKYYFDIKVDLSNITSKTLACLIDRLIIASSPWKSAQYYDEQNRNILLKAANQNFCTTRKAIDIPEESALLVYKDYNQTTRLMDRLIFYRGGNIKGSSSWPYIFYSESEAGSISGDSYARKFLMGKTYAQIRNLVGGDEAGATTFTFYSIIGRFKIAIEGNNNGVLYDAFFGCFPWCLVEAAFIDNGVLIIRMCTYQESLYSTAMPVPNMRMILPKNEIINKIKNMLDNGEIDQFGNPLT